MYLKLIYYLQIIIIYSLITSSFSSSIIEYDGWLQIELYHAIDSQHSDNFVNRGNITVSNLNSGSFDANQLSLTNEDRMKLKQLAENNGFYRLKLIVSNSNGEKTSFLTSSKACVLINSYLSDVLWVSLDHTGSVIGIAQTLNNEKGFSEKYAFDKTCKNLQHNQIDFLDDFNTDVVIKHMTLGPIPDTASFIQKIEREREARDRGEVKDNRGFIAKYWMYIVPVAILVLISGAAAPDPGTR